MKSKFATYSVLGRSAWFALAILLVVCCGPVKKLIELNYSNKALTALPPSSDNNKLRTFYREKHEVASYTHHAVKQSPATGLAIYLAAAFLLAAFLSQGNISPDLQPIPVNDLSGVPLYLRIRKLQV